MRPERPLEASSSLLEPSWFETPAAPALTMRGSKDPVDPHFQTVSQTHGTAIHATAVSIGGLGLLIRGPSKAGKSTLAAALLDASTRAVPIRLVGDDRVLVSRDHGGKAVVRPHPRIAGFIERRGLGIVAVSHVAEAPIIGIVALCGAPELPAEINLENFPVLFIVDTSTVKDRRDLTLRWFEDLASARSKPGATNEQHPRSKTRCSGARR